MADFPDTSENNPFSEMRPKNTSAFPLMIEEELGFGYYHKPLNYNLLIKEIS